MRIISKIFIVFLFFGLLLSRPTTSFAWHGHSYVGINLGVWPGPYYGYRNPYYYPYYADPYYPSTYTVVASSNYQPVIINGVTYYLNNGVYYIYTQYGYQAVAAPVNANAPVTQVAVTATPASVDTDDSFTINVPNEKGGYTSVALKKSGKGFIGPQGEFYSDFPKVSQLRAMYGK